MTVSTTLVHHQSRHSETITTKPLHCVECMFVIVTVLLVTTLKPSQCSLNQISNSTPDFSNCTCPGDQLTFECTSFGGIATVWHGSAFNCGYQDGLKVRDEIILIHNRFNSGVEGECGNSGQILAQSVGVENNTYFTSVLNVTVSTDMNNRTIETLCDTEKVDGSRMLVNIMRLTVQVATGFIQDVKISNVRLANVSRNLLIFSWSGDIPYCSTSYGYFIHTNNCGVCANKTKDTTVSCPFVSQGGRELCNFTVQVQACGEATGNNAVSIVVMPTVPDPPELQLLSQNHDESGRLLNVSILVMVNESLMFNISEGIDGSPISYTIIYVDSVNNAPCFNVTIPASECTCETNIMDICSCKHDMNFETVVTERCDQTDINITAFATNILGDGPVSDSITIKVTIENESSTTLSKECATEHYKTNPSTAVIIVVVLICAVLMTLPVPLVVAIIYLRRKQVVFTKLHCHSCFTKSSDDLKSRQQLFIQADHPSPAQGCLYADLNTLRGCSTLNMTLWEDRVEYAELQNRALQEGTNDIKCVTTTISNNDGTESESTKAQDPILENCLLYAELKHSGGTTKKSTSACTAVCTFTMDDKVLYSDIKHTADIANRSKSMSSAESTRVPPSHQLKPEKATGINIDDEMNLDMLLIQLRPQVTPKWHSFGMALGVEKDTLDKYSNLQEEECLVEILDGWLKNHTGKPSWREIAKALEEVQLQDLAEDMLCSYETGHLPIEVDMEAVPQLDQL